MLAAAAGSLYGQGTLVWSDEMNVDGPPDPSKWVFDEGGGGWGNNEAQYYTSNRLENARVEGGVLIIEAREEPWPSPRNAQNDYTSARLLSKGNGDWLYGRVEVRAKLPQGRGTWPAIWMLSTGNAYGMWPRSGEIDIMEHVGYDMGTVHGSLHSLAHNWVTETQPTASLEVANVATEFHVYAIEWSPNGIRFFVDESELMWAPNPGTGWEEWPFDQPFHLILNLAVGGFWGGQQGIDPDIWPQRMEIDYVRVYDLGHTTPLDTDGDTLTNDVDPDDDGDGLSDAEEHQLGTNILLQDTDGDGHNDAEEIEAGTNPLLSGSYPGRDPSILLINEALAEGEEPWILHTNRLNAEGMWTGQAGSWGGAYKVYDYVTPGFDNSATLVSYTEGDAAGAEHLLYQEWSATVMGLAPGDVIRFRGIASAAYESPEVVAKAFIRVLDGGYQPLPETMEIELGSEPEFFALESLIGTAPVNVLQVGVSITAPQTALATLTFSDLQATWNEPAPWGIYPVVDGMTNTGSWMGWLYVGHQPWVWSYSFSNWVHIPQPPESAPGAWVYVLNP